MTEKQLRLIVLKNLRRDYRPGVWETIVGGPYQRPGISDIWGIYRGQAVCIELKAPGKYPSVHRRTSTVSEGISRRSIQRRSRGDRCRLLGECKLSNEESI